MIQPFPGVLRRVYPGCLSLKSRLLVHLHLSIHRASLALSKGYHHCPSTAYNNFSASPINYQPPPLLNVLNSQLSWSPPFPTGNAIEVIIARSLRFTTWPPVHRNDWAANSSFDPFGFEPILPAWYSKPGIPFHRTARGEPRVEEGLNVGSGVGRCRGFIEVNIMCSNTHEVRFGPLLGRLGPKANVRT